MMRILITADPFIPVPPVNYGGIERIIYSLCNGLAQRGHDIKLLAHKDSKVSCGFVAYAGESTLQNTATLYRTVRSFKPEIIHSFSRLAYLLPVLPMKLPKIMSYQREPTISQVKKAVLLSKKNSLAFTGCSNYISNQIIPFGESYTVYNGVDLALYQQSRKTDDDAPLVFLGRIEQIKGTHEAIQIAVKSGRKLTIAGNVPDNERQYFEQKVKPFLSEDISYIGPVNDQQKNLLLQKAWAFLMPIRWNEPFGIVMIEAMACGTPVIGFNRGSVPEVVKHGLSGYIVEDIDGAAEAVCRVGALDRAAVRRYCEERFSMNVIIDQYLSVYNKKLQAPAHLELS